MSGTYWKEGKFMPALWAGSAPMGIMKYWFPVRQVPATQLRAGIMPEGKQFLQGWEEQGTRLGMKNPHQTLTEQKECVGALFTLPLLLLPFHSVWGSHLQPEAHLTHIKTKSCSERVVSAASLDYADGDICWKMFEFPVSVGAAKIFFFFFFSFFFPLNV